MMLASMEGAELATVVGSVVVSIVTASIAGVRWLGKHVDKLEARHVTEKGQQRTDFLNRLEKTDARNQERDREFLTTLAKRDSEFLSALGRIEHDCHQQRELDRKQREQDRADFLRLVGLHTSGDTGAFRDKSARPQKRSGSSEDARRESPQ